MSVLYTGLCYGGPFDRQVRVSANPEFRAARSNHYPYLTADPKVLSPYASSFTVTTYVGRKLRSEYGEHLIFLHEDQGEAEVLAEIRVITNLCRMMQGWRVPHNQWRVEALETHAGTGWHVTDHPSLPAALAMIELRMSEPGIHTAKITRRSTPCPKKPRRAFSEASASTS